MRVLAVTNMFRPQRLPRPARSSNNRCGLRRSGVVVDMLFVDRREAGTSVYTGLQRLVRAQTAECCPDIVHVMYGGIMAELVTRAIHDRPTVVTFHGSDFWGSGSPGFAGACFPVSECWRRGVQRVVPRAL